jgi:glycosyltransferase involved in cell wall biosynthesis
MPVILPDRERISGLAGQPAAQRSAPQRSLAPLPRVLFLVNSLVVGGAERQTVSLVNDLDCSVLRLSLGYLKPDNTLLPQLKRDRLDALLSVNVQHKLDLRAVRVLTDYIDARDVDVVLSANPYSALYGFLAGRRAKNPPRQVQVFHTTILQSFKEKAQMLLYRAVFRRLDLLVYVSELQRQYWQARGLRAKRELVIHNGINAELFTDSFTTTQKRSTRQRCGFQESDYVIGICATLRPEKAHGDFVAAVARLRAAGIAAKGLIIGDGPERAAIERRIADLGLTQQVAITGYQPDVRPFIAACDVMTLTSHAVETFSLAALEAMAMGKPVVLSEIGGAAEQVVPGVNGFMFSPGDIAALADRLTLLHAPELRSRMGLAAAAGVRERFTERGMTAAYTRELLALAASHQRKA